MKTSELIQASYFEAASQVHYATINSKCDDAHLWAGVMRQLASEMERFGEKPQNFEKLSPLENNQD